MSNGIDNTHGHSSWHDSPLERQQVSNAQAQREQTDTDDANSIWENDKPAFSEKLSDKIQSDETQREQKPFEPELLEDTLEPIEDADRIWDFQNPDCSGLTESSKERIQPSSPDEKLRDHQHPIDQNCFWGCIANVPSSANILTLPSEQHRAAINPLGTELYTAALQQAFGLNSATAAIALVLRQGKSGTGVLGLNPDGTAYQVNYCRKDTQWYLAFVQHWQDRKNHSKEEKERQQACLSQQYVEQNQEAINEWNEFYSNIATQFLSAEQQQALEDFIRQLSQEPSWNELTPNQAHQERSMAKATDIETQIDGQLSAPAKRGIFLDSLFWAYRQVQEIRYFKRSLTLEERNNLDLLFADQPDPPDDSLLILPPADRAEIDQWADTEYKHIAGQDRANPAGELWKTLQRAALMQKYPNVWNQVLAGSPAQRIAQEVKPGRTVEPQEESLSAHDSSTSEATTDQELEDLQQERVSAAIARLQANKVRINGQARSYKKDLSANSRPWIELRSLSQLDWRLAQRHLQLEHQLASLAQENAEIDLLRKDSNAETPNPANRPSLSAQMRGEEIQAQSKEIDAQVKLLAKTRRVMRCHFPALEMIDTVKVAQAPNTPQINEDILGTLSTGFGDVRYAVDEFQEQIAQDPKQAVRLTTEEMTETVLVPPAIALLEEIEALETKNDFLSSEIPDPTVASALLNQAEATINPIFSETVRSNLVLGQGNILLAGLDARLSAVEIEALGELPILQGFAGSLSATDMTFLMRGLKAGLDGKMTEGLAAIRPLKQKLSEVHQDLTWLIRQAGKGGDMVYNAEGKGFQRSQPIEFIADRLELLQDRLGLRKILDWVCNSTCLDL